MGETSTKPYLIRALHEWCTDNGYTPYITVQVDEHTMVPMAHVRDGQITLNVGTLATNRLVLGNEFIEFQARFSGVTENVYVPVGAVSAIYARETGAGMGFEVQPYEPPAAGAQGTAEPAEEGTADAASPSGDDTGGDEPKRPRLTIVVSPAGSLWPGPRHRRARSVRARLQCSPRACPMARLAGVAQLVEQLTCNEKVEGSIPFTGTISPPIQRRVRILVMGHAPSTWMTGST